MQVLAGPRQVGKTTLVLQLLEEPGIQARAVFLRRAHRTALQG